MFGLGIANMLLRFARQVVAGVTAQLTQQMTIVQQQALVPMNAIIQEVTGGVWIGQGADAFVQDIRTIFVPKTSSIFDAIGKVIKDLNHAVDVIDKADQQVQQKVKTLEDTFQNIYNG